MAYFGNLIMMMMMMMMMMMTLQAHSPLRVAAAATGKLPPWNRAVAIRTYRSKVLGQGRKQYTVCASHGSCRYCHGILSHGANFAPKVSWTLSTSGAKHCAYSAPASN
jgi:hypothetical protein